MKTKTIVHSVIFSSFALILMPSYAAFLSLPVSGAGSPYMACNNSSNFGFSLPILPPTDTCLVTQSGTNPPDSPTDGSGYSMYLGSSKTRSIQVNNVYTSGTIKTIGSLQDSVWKNAAGTSCIYGTKITMSVGADYQPGVTGIQQFEVNDLARGGFQGKAIKAAYSYPGTPSSLVYRMGRTYTSVQYKATPGYSALPPTGLGSQPSISSQQQADYDDNWVDFTTNVNGRHDDGSTSAASSWMFVKADGCPALNSSGFPIDSSDAIRLRQTAKDLNGNWQFFIEISMPGFAPAGSNSLPAHTNPY